MITEFEYTSMPLIWQFINLIRSIARPLQSGISHCRPVIERRPQCHNADSVKWVSTVEEMLANSIKKYQKVWIHISVSNGILRTDLSDSVQAVWRKPLKCLRSHAAVIGWVAAKNGSRMIHNFAWITSGFRCGRRMCVLWLNSWIILSNEFH